MQLPRHNEIAISKLPIGSSQKDKGKEQSQEDHHEDNIRPQSADEVDQTHQTHEKEEEAETSVEAPARQTIRDVVIRRVGAIGVESRRQGTA